MTTVNHHYINREHRDQIDNQSNHVQHENAITAVRTTYFIYLKGRN